MEKKKKNRSQRYEINRPRSRRRPKYRKYIKMSYYDNAYRC